MKSEQKYSSPEEANAKNNMDIEDPKKAPSQRSISTRNVVIGIVIVSMLIVIITIAVVFSKGSGNPGISFLQFEASDLLIRWFHQYFYTTNLRSRTLLSTFTVHKIYKQTYTLFSVHYLRMYVIFCLKIKVIKFIYSEKATKFCEISTLLLSYVVLVKREVEISQNFVAFSEYMNFTSK